MNFSLMTGGGWAPRTRTVLFHSLLITAIFVITACSAATDALPSATPSGGQTAEPTSVVSDGAISEPEPTVAPVGDTTSSRSITDSTGDQLSSDAGDDADASAAQQAKEAEDAATALVTDAIADQLGMDADSLAEQFGLDADDLASQFGLDPDALAAQFGADDAADDDDSDSTDFFASFFASFQNSAMDQSLEAALVPSECAAAQSVEYPDGYYTGELIETHFHMPPLNDDPTGGDGSYGGAGGVDSAEYAAIDPNDRPLLGVTTTLDEIACSLRQEGTPKAFTFFPVYEDSPDALLDLAENAVDRHGDLFVPFIQSTGSEISTVEAEVLEELLGKKPGLFVGFGEVGDSPTEPINLPPDAPIYVGDFEVARDHGLLVYFHPGVGDHENLDRALKMFPDVNFLVHGDFVRPHIGDLMADNPNVYYTYNDIFDEVTPKFRFGDKQDFIDAMEADWDALLDQAMVHYEDLINTYPDKFMWGTDRADIVWNYHADIGQLLVKFGRDFIGRFDPDIQDKIGYLNAEALLQ